MLLKVVPTFSRVKQSKRNDFDCLTPVNEGTLIL